jgi:hypothetical protein
MSLVIHTVVRDGIVVSADTRTTCKDGKGNTRYDDTAEKIIPFPNRIIVTHTGDSMINDKLSVTDFLIDLRRKCGKKITLTDLPIKLLNEYLPKCGNRIAKTYFKVSGYDEVCMLGGRTYSINGEDKTITLSRQPFNYGASFGGTIDVAFAMMNVADYSNMSLKEAIDLTKSTLLSNITAYKYAPSQIIGGNVQTYVIDVVKDISGWLIDNDIIPDSNAPDDGLMQYREQQTKRFIQQMNKQKSKKGIK